MTKMKLLVAAAVTFCGTASAQTTAVFDLTSGVFANPYSFSVAGPSSVIGDTNSAGISWFGALLQSPQNSYTALDANPDDGFSFAGLAAGNYVLTFLGSGKGGYGGFFTVTTSAPATVPEPGAYAAILMGLSALVFVAWRRRA